MPSPRAFISYSWTNANHEAWVLNLATELRENGVDVILDKWDLRPGQDAYTFMEQMVTDPSVTKVLMICDHAYVAKADQRSGGVGVEAQILSPEIYARRDQDKFVAVVLATDEQGKAVVPTYYKSRIFVDFSDNSRFVEKFEELLRWLHDKPLYVKPELGKPPLFLTSGSPVVMGTTARAKRALDAISTGRDSSDGAIDEYFSTYVENLGRFRLASTDGERDDPLIASLDELLPCRNEALGVLSTIARYRPTDEAIRVMHRFFENLLPLLDRLPESQSWSDGDFDNFRFLAHELFLYASAYLLRYERYDALGSLLRTPFFASAEVLGGAGGATTFGVLNQPTILLEIRNRRLELRRVSLRADLLKKRSGETGLAFVHLMQADFFLFIRDCLDCITDPSRGQDWFPHTLIYACSRSETPFEVFARSQSRTYFARVCRALDIDSEEPLRQVVGAFKENKLRVPRWQFDAIEPLHLMAFHELAKRP